MDGWMGVLMVEWMKRWMGGLMDGVWMDEWVGG